VVDVAPSAIAAAPTDAMVAVRPRRSVAVTPGIVPPAVVVAAGVPVARGVVLPIPPVTLRLEV